MTISAAISGIEKKASGASPVVLAAVQQASQRTGVSFSYLMDKAAQESSYNPNAKASGSSATGLYQFIDTTWLGMVKMHGASYGLGAQAAAIKTDADGDPVVSNPQTRQQILNMRKDPAISAAMAAEYTKDNMNTLQKQTGRPVGATELSLAHFMGVGGATKFLNTMKTSPSASAASLFPAAADSNPSIFYDQAGNAQSLSQVYARFAVANSPTQPTGVAPAVAQAATGVPSAAIVTKTLPNGTLSQTTLAAAGPQSTFTAMMLASLSTPLDDDSKSGVSQDAAHKRENGNWASQVNQMKMM